MSTPFHRYPTGRSDNRLRTSDDNARDHAQAVEAWFALHARSLYLLKRDDARAIYGWQIRTLQSGERVFGIQCPTGLVVTAAGEYVEPDSDLSPAYCAVREGVRQRAALWKIASKVAGDDGAWHGLMEPIADVDGASKTLMDTALLILLNQNFGNAADAFWRVICTWHREHYGGPPNYSRAAFQACLVA